MNCGDYQILLENNGNYLLLLVIISMFLILFTLVYTAIKSKKLAVVYLIILVSIFFVV